MKSVAVVLFAVIVSGCAFAPGAPPAASDEFQIETTVLAVHNVLSGPAGRCDWRQFEGLFAPDARIVIAGTGTGAMTAKQYAERFTPKFNAEDMFERLVAPRVQVYGDVAQVWSTYEGRQASNQERASARGIIGVPLVRIDGQWKVQSLIRQEEDAGHPIPPQFTHR
jgi:SnoaL-like protein